MKLSHKLEQWTKAKLITSVQAQKIEAFEISCNTNNLLMVLLILAGCAIGLGIIALIAANWQNIPGFFKLIGGFILLAFFLSGTYITQVSRHFHLKGLFLTLSFFMTGAQISLISQVFQCSGSLSAACLLWSLLTFPMVFLASWAFVPFFWLIISVMALPKFLELLEPLACWIGIDKIAIWIETFYHHAPVYSTIIIGAFTYLCLGSLSILAKRFYQRTELPIWSVLKFLMYFCMCLTLLLGEIILRWWHNVPWIATCWMLFLLGITTIYEGFCRQEAAFIRMIVIIELYLFYIFASFYSNLWTTGWGLIAFGGLMLAAMILAKKTIYYFKRKNAS